MHASVQERDYMPLWDLTTNTDRQFELWSQFLVQDFLYLEYERLKKKNIQIPYVLPKYTDNSQAISGTLTPG